MCSPSRGVGMARALWACAGASLLSSACDGPTTMEPIPCVTEWMVAAFQGSVTTGGGVLQLTLQDSVRDSEISLSDFQFVRSVLIEGRPASGASGVGDAGVSSSLGRIGLMLSGSPGIGSQLPVLGSFVPPGWYRGPIVSVPFPNAVKIFLHTATGTIADASGTFTPTSIKPLTGGVNATVIFPGQIHGMLSGSLSFRRSVLPAGCDSQ